MKLLECENENIKQQIQEEKTENNKLKTLSTTKDERIEILDKKILDSKSDKICPFIALLILIEHISQNTMFIYTICLGVRFIKITVIK